MTTSQTIGHTLRLARVAARLQQQELAIRLEVTANYLSLVEHGHRDPSMKFLRRFAKELDVPLGRYLYLALRKAEEEALNTRPPAAMPPTAGRGSQKPLPAGEGDQATLKGYGMDKPALELGCYYDYGACSQYLHERDGHNERDYAGRQGNPGAPYQDFWHFVLEHEGDLTNGSYFTMDETWKEDAAPWQQEIIEKYLEAFAIPDETGQRAIEFYVWW